MCNLFIQSIDGRNVFCYPISINQWQTEGGNIMNLAAIIWFAMMVAFLVAEAACPIHLVSIWFAAGALVAAIAGYFGAAVWLQITLFLLVSCALVAMLWPFIKKFLNPKLAKTNIDAVVDSQGYVTADIDNLAATGQVKLGAMEWTARSTSGKPIAKGTLVKVDRIEGVKAFVSPAEVPVNL
jgi:membrane protein implicated in regulation of membrane protease activity